jgi:hypothetical protein
MNVMSLPFQTLENNRPETQHHIAEDLNVQVLLLTVQGQKVIPVALA